MEFYGLSQNIGLPFVSKYNISLCDSTINNQETPIISAKQMIDKNKIDYRYWNI